MNPEELERLRQYYDTTDTSADLDDAVRDDSVDTNPMIGITVRLPSQTLNSARDVADAEGVKVTALIRKWVEQALQAASADGATATPSGIRSTAAPQFDNVVHADFNRSGARVPIRPLAYRNVN